MSIVAISGGVGGAKLALGLYRVLPKYALTIIVNTASFSPVRTSGVPRSSYGPTRKLKPSRPARFGWGMWPWQQA
jgi:hypothetical protein